LVLNPDIVSLYPGDSEAVPQFLENL